jgi:formylglycine-generating enzyme required for sulfatase activity
MDRADTSILITTFVLVAAAILPAGAQSVDTPRPGHVFRDCPDCSEMVVVPAGRFILGSDELGNERPAHEVTIGKPFAIGVRPVTFEQWNACVAAKACTHNPPRWGRREDEPVLSVSWDDITNEYLPWLRRTTGKDYRLASEAEWVYAARDKSFGLRDTGESTREWVEDCYRNSYDGAPVDGTARTTDCEPATYGPGLLRVVRGTERNITPPSVSHILPPLIAVSRGAGASGFRDKTRGFRVARPL